MELQITTSDFEFLSTLEAVNIPDLQASEIHFRADTIDLIQPVKKLAHFTITASTAIAFSLFSSWLYDRIKEKQPNTTTINNHSVVNNPEQITIIINNCIQQIQNDSKANK